VNPFERDDPVANMKPSRWRFQFAPSGGSSMVITGREYEAFALAFSAALAAGGIPAA